MRVIYRKIRHARYLYIKRNVENVWGARYTLVARYLSKNTVSILAKSVTISFQYNIESVYFFYSNPVYYSLSRLFVLTSQIRYSYAVNIIQNSPLQIDQVTHTQT